MAIEIIMPKAGIDMEEGQIVEWKKKVGDKINKDDVILEIMTDKTSMEIQSENEGYLLGTLYNDGDTVPVTTIIGYMGEQGEAMPTGGNEPKKEEAPAPKVEEKVEIPGIKETPKEAHAEKMVSTKGEGEYDIVVIGGGPAGYVGAIRASQLGAKVAIVEKSELGGTCLNRGCIPTKTFLKNAEIIEHIEIAKKRGIMLASTDFTVDMPKTVAFKNTVVKTLTNGVQGLLKSNKIEIFKGTGIIDKNHDVVVDGKVLKTDKILFAGGSKVHRINIKGIDSKLVLTSDDILDIQEVPKRLAIIGGGVIGVELGQAFETFGSEVTIIEMMDRIIPSMDREVSEGLRKVLESKGMKILTNVKMEEIVDKGDHLVLKLEGGQEVVADRALLSIGRVPDLEGLGEANLELDRGRIKVDKYMESSVKGIYAPGDINGVKMLAHAAFRMAEVAAENAILGNHRETKLETTPAAIYTLPEVASVGLTEEQAKEKYGNIRVGKFSFAGNGRAIASSETAGFIKVIADDKYGEILGVHIMGPVAAEMINEAAALMEMEITVDEVIKTIHGHPTYSEAMYEAFCDVKGEAVHLPKRK